MTGGSNNSNNNNNSAEKNEVDEVIILYKDTGIGIDSEVFPRLFAKFASKSERGNRLSEKEHSGQSEYQKLLILH